MAGKKRKWYVWVGVAVALFAFGATIAGSFYDDSDVGTSGPSRGEVLKVATLASLTAGRTDLGFAAGSVDSLLNDATSRSGLLETGFLLSTDERAKLDARVGLMEAMRGARSRAASGNGFGGTRLEHTGNGVYHVYHTSDSDGLAVKADFQSSAPSGASVQFHVVTNSKKDLIAVRDQLWSDLDDSDIGTGGLHAIGLDVKNNRLVLELDSSISEQDRISSEGLASRLKSEITSVSFTVIYTEPATESECGEFPDDCVNPMMGGIAIKKGSTSGPACTLGFMVEDGSDTQALTSGHCGWSGSTLWFHDGYGSSNFGYEVDDDAYEDIGRDGMLVQIPESQGSNDVAYCVGQWGCLQITGYIEEDDLENNMPLNTLGRVSGHRSGVISDADHSWTGGNCGCIQYGFKATYTGAPGDSGGPVWYGYDAIALIVGGTSSYSVAVPIEPLLSFYDVDLRTS